MITAAQLDYLENLPAIPDDIGFCDASNSLEQIALAIELFPDFVKLITALRLSTLQPGSAHYNKHEDLTERWIAMLSKALVEPGPHLEKLLPLTAQLLDAEISDPVRATQPTLSEQIKEAVNENSKAMSWSNPHDGVGNHLKTGKLSIDQVEKLFPVLFKSKLLRSLKSIVEGCNSDEFVNLCQIAQEQKSDSYLKLQCELIENLNRAEFSYNHPARMVVLGKFVSTEEYAQRLELLVDRYAFQPLPLNLESGESDESYIRRKVSDFKELLTHADFVTAETLSIDFYAALSSGRMKHTSFKNELSAFLGELGAIGLDMCRLSASVVKGSWSAGYLDDRMYQEFVEKAVYALSRKGLEPTMQAMLCKEFIRHTPEKKLLNANLSDEAYSYIYKLRGGQEFIEKIQNTHHLENVLSGDLGL